MTQAIQDELAEALKEERLALWTLARDATGTHRSEAFRRWQRAAARVSAAAMSLKEANAGHDATGVDQPAP